MNITITAKLKMNPTIEQAKLLEETIFAYRKGCNFVSRIVFESKNLVQVSLHKATYHVLRSSYGLRSQMAQSVMKTVIARYKTNKSNGHDWSLVQFKKPEYDLVWNRDYTLSVGTFSVNTLQGRVKIPFETKGMEQYFDGSWSFGTAKLVYKHKKWFLHIPMTKEIQEASVHNIKQVVGIDFGINFVATSYDSQGNTSFFNGKIIKHKRARYKAIRKQLQRKQTPSARKRLKEIGNRENRWMTDVNHCVSKALVSEYGADTLFVIEDLTGIRVATERVKCKDRYVSVSWAFFQLRQMLEYKARMEQSKVIAVDPAYTSQICPKCGHAEKANRNKKKHIFCCKTCAYTSNDDRIGAMNLQRKGMEYIVEVTKEA
ncbi:MULTISPECIES: RNA-guided endonuclease TnpB family protein [unclassified Bacillus (in: firmicutes)]|uniref:RNA-guided endonuclease InsQ/TnpB family protein n=1 Tax=unclassified Bacillus (in: firmicutes) TaxID=185979 RepID=UPI0008E45D80|nr:MULTISPECIES: RNA-guided endonuclease TnpB family protein [unclassified Bacillus (in: firmicutes)]SFI80937.1 transposase, IS605 OrfB family, central region [Bacillus sp. 71mf]SFS85133.1 transposase, IS605 OrfB family, central region [Bacillus sp. 103mf]